MTGLAANLAVHASWLEDTDPAMIEKLTEAKDLALAVKAEDHTGASLTIPIGLHSQQVTEVDAVRNTWESAVHLNPRGPPAHTKLAVFHLFMGEPARAIPLLERSFGTERRERTPLCLRHSAPPTSLLARTIARSVGY